MVAKYNSTPLWWLGLCTDAVHCVQLVYSWLAKPESWSTQKSWVIKHRLWQYTRLDCLSKLQQVDAERTESCRISCKAARTVGQLEHVVAGGRRGKAVHVLGPREYGEHGCLTLNLQGTQQANSTTQKVGLHKPGNWMHPQGWTWLRNYIESIQVRRTNEPTHTCLIRGQRWKNSGSASMGGCWNHRWAGPYYHLPQRLLKGDVIL